MFSRLTSLAVAAIAIAATGAPLLSQSTGVIRGRLADSASGAPIAVGTITLRRGTDAAVATVVRPKDDGSFRAEGLAPGSYTLSIRVLGFAPLRRTGIVLSAASPTADVGDLKLTSVATTLEGQRVVAEREETVVSPDRTSYSTKNMTAAAGGTAVDVLRNIPLVSVDASNKVSLRGDENVVIQINGRPTPLKGDQLAAFLAQLPANTVKTVEVATNPSAKDDPEGTAGIINIVLDQEAELGLSGGVNVGTSTTGMVNTNGNIGKQQGKLTVFLSVGVYRDQNVTSGTTSRTNLVIPVPVFVETNLAGTQHPRNANMNFRSEYRLNTISSLSLDSYAWGGRYGGDYTSFNTDLDASRDVLGLFDQFTSSRQTYGGAEADFTFHRQGQQPTDPQLTAEIDLSRFNNGNNTDLSSDVIQADASTSAIPSEQDHTSTSGNYFSAKTDYSHPFTITSKLETGFKIISRENSTDFDAAYLDTASGVFVPAPSRTNGFNYAERISGVYGLMSQRLGKFQLQGGTRVENAVQHFSVRPADQQFDRSYASLYPSAILSYNFTDVTTGKLSYSRRVSRPNPYQLNPVEFHQDARNVFRGNPNLAAEYTDAVEASLQQARGWGSAQVTTYVRHTAHAVRNIRFVDSTGISVSTYDNVASTSTVGSDLNLNVHGGPVTLGGGGSVYHYSSDASNLTGDLSAHDIVWSSRLNATYKVSPLVDAQGFMNYRAPYRTEGGSQLANMYMNFSLRYKPWGEQGGAVALRVSDPFALAKYGYRTANGTVIESSQRYFQQRVVFLSVSRNFGQELKLRPKERSDAGDAPTP
jgi:ferric enterobactin receptor